MKKFTSLLLAVLMMLVVVLATGCGDGGATESGAQNVSDSENTGDGGFDFTLDGTTGDGAQGTVSGGATGTTSGGATGTTSGGATGTTSGGATGNSGNKEEIGTDINVGGNITKEEAEGLTTIRLATRDGALFSGQAAGSSTYAKMFTDAAKKMRKELKVNLKFMAISIADENAVATALYAGKTSFDMIYYDAAFARNLALNGLLAKQNDIKTIDFTQPQFKKAAGFNEGMTFNGNVYGSLFGSELDYSYVMFCNQTMIDTYTGGKYDILQLYKDGQWTMEKFWEICSAVKQVDANGNPTIYGACMGIGNGVFLAAYTGGTVSRKVEGGKEVYYPSMLSDAGVQCIEELRQKQYTEKVILGTTAVDQFKNSTVAMYPGYATSASELVSAVNGEVVMVPIPKASTMGKHVFSAQGRYYMIPAKADNKDLIGKVYMMLSKEVNMDQYLHDLYLESGLSEENVKLATSEFSAYARPEFIGGINTLKFDSELSVAYQNGTGSVKQIFDATRDRFQAAIDDCYDRAKNLK